MPSSKINSTGLIPSAGEPTPHIPNDALTKCAQLIAHGEIEWPLEISDEQQGELLALVRHYRRAKLVRFLASQIAADIARDKRGDSKEAKL